MAASLVPAAPAPAAARPTMRDVAAAARVSVGAASIALRDAPSTIRVSPQTRERVRAAARRLGYTPNHTAQALRTGRTHAIGVAVRQLQSPFFGAIVEGIEAACREAGYLLLLGHAHADGRSEREIVGLLSRGRPDGLLLVGEVPDDEAVIRTALAQGTPTVLVARPAAAGAPGVTLDHAAAVRLALDHLAQLGHRSVALRVAAAPAPTPTSRLRLHAAQTYAAARGWPPPRTFDVDERNPDALRAWLARAARADPPVTAVLANDPVAVQVLKAAEAARLPVPARVSIIALDGTEVTTYTTPELTSVTPPLAELGATAARRLLDAIHRAGQGTATRPRPENHAGGPSLEPTPSAPPAVSTLLAPGFTVRGSTGPAPLGQ